MDVKIHVNCDLFVVWLMSCSLDCIETYEWCIGLGLNILPNDCQSDILHPCQYEHNYVSFDLMATGKSRLSLLHSVA